jgi:hypothetical protein
MAWDPGEVPCPAKAGAGVAEMHIAAAVATANDAAPCRVVREYTSFMVTIAPCQKASDLLPVSDLVLGSLSKAVGVAPSAHSVKRTANADRTDYVTRDSESRPLDADPPLRSS